MPCTSETFDSGAPISRQCHDGLEQNTYYQAMRLAGLKVHGRSKKQLGGLCTSLTKCHVPFEPFSHPQAGQSISLRSRPFIDNISPSPKRISVLTDSLGHFSPHLCHYPPRVHFQNTAGQNTCLPACLNKRQWWQGLAWCVGVSFGGDIEPS